MAKIDWNPEENEAGGGFEPLPKGRYLCRIEESEEKETKAGDGRYLEFVLVVEKGEFAKRKLWARLNTHNPSEVAQRIGREQFNALCLAAGFEIGAVRKTESLHGKKVVALIDIETGPRGSQNRVTGFMAPAEAGAGGGARAPEKPAGKSAGKPAAKPPKDESDPDDDIPF